MRVDIARGTIVGFIFAVASVAFGFVLSGFTEWIVTPAQAYKAMAVPATQILQAALAKDLTSRLLPLPGL